MVNLTCPKCNGLSWITIDDNIPVQECYCGLHRFLELNAKGKLVPLNPSVIDTPKLPATRTKLYKTLKVLYTYGEISSREVAKHSGMTVSVTTTHLSVLRTRGLITATECRKGQSGGSIWKATEPVIKLMSGEV
jgi:DNA-binding transcriptional ArsR family regulator